MNGWTIFFGLVAAYILFLVWLNRTGRMERWNLSLLLGFILMIRTQHGKGTIDAVARPKRFWNVFGDLGTATTLVGMFAMTVLMIWSMIISLRPDSGIEPPSASEVLVIPGVNPLVPLWYGIFALIVTLVVHEGGHGVLARANGLRVRSLGLLFAIVPIGAFVEPDEDDLMKASRRKRLRVFAAGPMVNLVVGAIVLAGFAGMVGSAEAHPGLPIMSVTQDDPAEIAGILPGDRIVQAGTMQIASPVDFTEFMDQRSPGDQVVFVTSDGSEHAATLTSRWAAMSEQERQAALEADPAAAEALEDQAFLGVHIYDTELYQGVLSDPVGRFTNFLFLVSLPFGEIRGQPHLGTYLPEFFDGGEAYWVGVTVLFWVFWINLMVGLTNILPMLPLDGGHIFRDSVAAAVDRVRPRMDEETKQRLIGRAAGGMSFLILGAFLIQVFAPRLVQ